MLVSNAKEVLVKQRHWILTAVVAATLSFGWTAAGWAQLKLAYVNSQKVLETHQPAIDAQKKLEAENAVWGQEMQKMNDQLRQLQEQLEQQSLLLSDAKKREKAQEIQNLAMKAQQYQTEKWGDQGEFFKRRQELLQPIIDAVQLIINKAGQEGGYDFIFDTINANLLFAQPKYDLTDDIIARLKKESPATASGTAKPAGK